MTKSGILAQSKPAAITLTDAYIVPNLKTASVNSIIIANEVASDATLRISLAIKGEADTLKQYIFYDVKICPNETIALQIGVNLSAKDVVRVYSSSGNLAFNVLGIQYTDPLSLSTCP